MFKLLNQVVISQFEHTHYKTNKKIKQEAEDFISEQKELSKNLDGGEKIE